MTVIYSSINSGGYWWLNADQWRALENSGWKVEWEQPGFATSAALKCDSREEAEAAVANWERATGLDSQAEGCDCCGRPHEFHVYDFDM